MSKDGDWMVREEEEAFNHVIHVLNNYGAIYRFGAPLDIRWMSQGWIAHFEFKYKKLRVRTDFFSKPPRISLKDCQRIWNEQENREIPFLDPSDLAELKKTNREKDYVIIGELARIMPTIEKQLLYSRSALDLIRLANEYPELIYKCSEKRPLLAKIQSSERDKLEQALDAERREMIHQNEKRLLCYINALKIWQEYWTQFIKKLSGKSLIEMHEIIIKEAENRLPFRVESI
jgi:hypothetical protein